MSKHSSIESARNEARRQGASFGLCVCDGKFYVGTRAQLEALPIVSIETPGAVTKEPPIERVLRHVGNVATPEQRERIDAGLTSLCSAFARAVAEQGNDSYAQLLRSWWRRFENMHNAFLEGK